MSDGQLGVVVGIVEGLVGLPGDVGLNPWWVRVRGERSWSIRGRFASLAWAIAFGHRIFTELHPTCQTLLGWDTVVYEGLWLCARG